MKNLNKLDKHSRKKLLNKQNNLTVKTASAVKRCGHGLGRCPKCGNLPDVDARRMSDLGSKLDDDKKFRPLPVFRLFLKCSNCGTDMGTCRSLNVPSVRANIKDGSETF